MNRSFNYISSIPWVCTEEYLSKMIDISERVHEIPENLENRTIEQIGGVVYPESNGMVETFGSTAILKVIGPIFRYASMFENISGATSVQSLNKQFQRLENDPSISQIILVIDSPGGEVAGISEFSKNLKNSSKKVVAYVDGTAASGAYWIASSCSVIYVNDTSMLGSVGAVISVSKKVEGKTEFVSSVSPNKRSDVETDSGKIYVQSLVDKIGNIFVETVAENRNVSVDYVIENFGKGGIIIGKETLPVKMADKLISLKDLISQETNAIMNQDEILTKDENMEEYEKGVKDERERVIAIFSNSFSSVDPVVLNAISEGVKVEDALKSFIAERKKMVIGIAEEIKNSETVSFVEDKVSSEDDILMSEFNGDEKSYNAYKNAMSKNLVKIKR
jgi:ClpP class serine protease